MSEEKQEEVELSQEQKYENVVRQKLQAYSAVIKAKEDLAVCEKHDFMLNSALSGMELLGTFDRNMVAEKIIEEARKATEANAAPVEASPEVTDSSESVSSEEKVQTDQLESVE